MIRYPISEAELIARIDSENSTWRTRAQARTQRYIQAGRYSDTSDIWGEIKNVYIRLQHEKCAYCETKLQGSVLASKVHEVEHYRPKSSIKAWPNPKVQHWQHLNLGWPTGTASAVGYYRLAYHHLNYAIACTRCNSTLKSNYFPIRGARDLQGLHPQHMQAESALLLYPVSSIDPDDPEDIITFEGVLAVPTQPTGPANERAVTNIEFFQLNHQDLTLRRGRELLDLYIALELSRNAPTQQPLADKVIAMMCHPESQFSACNKAFLDLYNADATKAQALTTQIAAALP